MSKEIEPPRTEKYFPNPNPPTQRVIDKIDREIGQWLFRTLKENKQLLEERDYLKRLEKKVLNNELIPRPKESEETYSQPRKRITEEDYDPYYRNKDVYTNVRVGKYNDLVNFDEAEEIEFKIHQIMAFFSFQSDLTRRVYEDDWNDYFLMKSQGKLLHYYILNNCDKILTARDMGIKYNSLNKSLSRLFIKLEKYPILNQIEIFFLLDKQK